MKGDFEYRGYVISRFGSEFIARSVDQDEESPSIISPTLSGLIGRIDEMWHALERRDRPPIWIRQWLKNASIEMLYPDRIMARHRALWRSIKVATATALAGAVIATGASAFDGDREGTFTMADVHALVDLVITGTKATTARTVIAVMNGEPMEMTFRYTKSTDAHIEIINLTPVIQAGDPMDRNFDGVRDENTRG